MLQFDGCRQLTMGPLLLSCCGIEHTEVTVAVCLEWVHIQFLSQNWNLLVADACAPFTLYNCLCM
jgi:hypothetical protein